MQILKPQPAGAFTTRTPMFIDHEVIRITRNGTWLSDGQEISHDQTLRAYKKNIGRDEQGYFVRLGKDFKRIEVEDTAWFVELAFRDPVTGKVVLRLSDDSEVELDPSKLHYSPGRLTVSIRGDQEARFLPQAYHWTLLQMEEGFLSKLDRSGDKL